ncbi:MAG: IclR family transcriptional regulator [Spirochaetaceae bacterium]|nr:IclR family transcriptional regulator [Spirochaetaceae bacterium]
MSESAGKALDILFYLANAGDQVTLARLSRETGMNKATALRYLSVLESRGVVEKRDGGWSLGLSLFELGSRVPVRQLVAEKVRPIIERLARETGESVNLAYLAGDSAIYLDRAEANRSLRMRSVPGDRLPLYCTGVGKAILSLLPEERIRAILGPGPLPRITEATLTDPEDVLREALRARELGYGVDREEFEVGLTCYAMPLRLPGSDFAGAISVSGPTARMKNPEVKERFLTLLKQAVDDALMVLEPYHYSSHTAAENSTGCP